MRPGFRFRLVTMVSDRQSPWTRVLALMQAGVIRLCFECYGVNEAR